MVSKDFEVGDLIWAKMKGFPFWPGKIIEPPADAKSPKQKKAQHYVFFFGSDNHAWIMDENIVPHDDSMVQSANKKKSAAYQSAIETIVSLSKNKAEKGKNVVQKVLKEKEENAEKESPNQSKTPNSVNNASKKSEKRDKCVSVKKADMRVQRKVKKRPLSLIGTDIAESSVSYPKSQRVENDYADLLANVPVSMGYSHVAAVPSYDSSPHQSAMTEHTEQPPTPVLDTSEALRNREIVACSKKIGFLGLGNMGQDMVKNLLNSGHHVTIWNRTAEKMDTFVKAGASKGQTPADVVCASDVTFCCVSDPEAVNSIVYGDSGVVKGFESCTGSNKGYVEMTSIDPETSKAIADEITLKGGRYLEAPIAGPTNLTIEGPYFCIIAGDRTLFSECETCFLAMGKCAVYISTEIGAAANMNLIHSMLNGTLYAAMGEAMALIKDCDLSQGDFLEIFELGPLNCRTLLDKGRSILQRNTSTNMPLRHIRKNLILAVSVSATSDQPVPIAAAANEAYKRTKGFRDADYDASAIHQGTR